MTNLEIEKRNDGEEALRRLGVRSSGHDGGRDRFDLLAEAVEVVSCCLCPRVQVGRMEHKRGLSLSPDHLLHQAHAFYDEQLSGLAFPTLGLKLADEFDFGIRGGSYHGRRERSE